MSAILIENPLTVHSSCQRKNTVQLFDGNEEGKQASRQNLVGTQNADLGAECKPGLVARVQDQDID